MFAKDLIGKLAIRTEPLKVVGINGAGGVCVQDTQGYQYLEADDDNWQEYKEPAMRKVYEFVCSACGLEVGTTDKLSYELRLCIDCQIAKEKTNDL